MFGRIKHHTLYTLCVKCIINEVAIAILTKSFVLFYIIIIICICDYISYASFPCLATTLVSDQKIYF